MRTYLNISYQQKDAAKAAARAADTRIQWDAQSKRWYWEGQSDLPKALHQYAPSRQSDAERRPFIRKSYGFHQSAEQAAEAMGITVDELRAEEAGKQAELDEMDEQIDWEALNADLKAAGYRG